MGILNNTIRHCGSHSNTWRPANNERRPLALRKSQQIGRCAQSSSNKRGEKILSLFVWKRGNWMGTFSTPCCTEILKRPSLSCGRAASRLVYKRAISPQSPWQLGPQFVGQRKEVFFSSHNSLSVEMQRKPIGFLWTLQTHCRKGKTDTAEKDKMVSSASSPYRVCALRFDFWFFFSPSQIVFKSRALFEFRTGHLSSPTRKHFSLGYGGGMCVISYRFPILSSVFRQKYSTKKKIKRKLLGKCRKNAPLVYPSVCVCVQ